MALHTIEVYLQNLDQLITSDDANVIPSKLLDSDVAQFIYDSVDKVKRVQKSQFLIKFLLPKKDIDDITQQNIQNFVNKYFSYQESVARKDKSVILTGARRNLVVAMAFAVVVFILAYLFYNLIPRNDFLVLLFEGIMVIALWVSFWQPIQGFLFDWWTSQRRAIVNYKIGSAKIEILSHEAR